ncbi:MAG TPA: CBS domain-containing protein [Chloroflexi bacterium]|nr:CBS domain-containing protein [Chloroflexota bacterium]
MKAANLCHGASRAIIAVDRHPPVGLTAHPKHSDDKGRSSRRDGLANYHLRAEDIMQVEVATILDDATVSEAAEQMRLEGVRSLIIEPHDAGDPYGIVTYTDIVKRVLAEGRDPDQVHVYEIMTKPAIVISPRMKVQYIARLFCQANIGHVPVVESGSLRGMVSMTDLITEVIAEPT